MFLCFYLQAPRNSQASSKVTSILPYEDTLWVGTADGHIAIYNVVKLEMPEVDVADEELVHEEDRNVSPVEQLKEEEGEENNNSGDNDVTRIRSVNEGETNIDDEDVDSGDKDRVDRSKSKRKTRARNYEMVADEFGIVPPPIPPHRYEVEQTHTVHETHLDAINLPLPLSDAEHDSDIPLSQPPPVLVTDIDDGPPELTGKESMSTMLDSPQEPLSSGLKRVPTPPGPVTESKNRVPSIPPLPALDLECQLPDPEDIASPSGDDASRDFVMHEDNASNKHEKVKRKGGGSGKAKESLEVDKDQLGRSSSGISGDFVMVEQSTEDLDESMRSQSPLSASASYDDHSDDEPRSRTKKRKGSKKRLNSPHALRKLLSPRPSKEKLDDYPPHNELKPTTSSLGRMFGKLTRGNSAKTNKYRYSRELRDVTRRGSLGPVAPVSMDMTSYDSEQSLTSFATSESKPSSNNRTSKPALVRKSSKPMFDTSDIEVHPLYDLQIQAKRKISENQVRCLIQTR